LLRCSGGMPTLRTFARGAGAALRGRGGLARFGGLTFAFCLALGFGFRFALDFTPGLALHGAALALRSFRFGPLSLRRLTLGAFTLGAFTLGAFTLGAFTLGAFTLGAFTFPALALRGLRPGARRFGRTLRLRRRLRLRRWRRPLRLRRRSRRLRRWWVRLPFRLCRRRSRWRSLPRPRRGSSRLRLLHGSLIRQRLCRWRLSHHESRPADRDR
jgi:hypothetical protein